MRATRVLTVLGGAVVAALMTAPAAHANKRLHRSVAAGGRADAIRHSARAVQAGLTGCAMIRDGVPPQDVASQVAGLSGPASSAPALWQQHKTSCAPTRCDTDRRATQAPDISPANVAELEALSCFDNGARRCARRPRQEFRQFAALLTHRPPHYLPAPLRIAASPTAD